MEQEALVEVILGKLAEDAGTVSAQFNAERASPIGTRFACIENLLPLKVATEIYEAFPKNVSRWREADSFRERKLTSKAFDEFPPILKAITFALQDRRVIDMLSEQTGIRDQIGDPKLYAGGLSMMRQNDFLNPHIDNSHEEAREYYRRLNLLYYVTPDWKLSDGGNLELWDRPVRERVTIASAFNRLVLMETNQYSWHSVSKVAIPRSRCCVSNYYFSEKSPTGGDYFHITAYSGRPEEPVKRVVSTLDRHLRTLVRKVVKSGVGRRDVYDPSNNNHAPS